MRGGTQRRVQGDRQGLFKHSTVAHIKAEPLRKVHVLPKSLLGRLLAILWLTACIAVLAFGYMQRAAHDMPIVLVWFMVILSFPLGLVAVPLVGVAWPAVVEAMGQQYQPFRDEFPLWVVAVVAGYWQWFVVVPLVAKRFLSRRKKSGA